MASIMKQYGTHANETRDHPRHSNPNKASAGAGHWKRQPARLTGLLGSLLLIIHGVLRIHDRAACCWLR